MTVPATDDPGLLVHAYVDGELDPAHALELERQIETDPALAAERERIEALQRVIAERLPRVEVPPGLERRITGAIGGSVARSSRLRAFSPGPSWRALAASIMLTAFVASGSTWFVLHPQPHQAGRLALGSGNELADMVLASHIRSLMATQSVDVVSSDQHTVKPWFNGRVSEAPRVVDLASEGFPLVGGRIDVIGRTPVPTLVYKRRQHVISLTAIPSDEVGAVPAGNRTIAGYNLLTWTQGGVVYWAVSNVALPDLETFAKDFRTAAA